MNYFNDGVDARGCARARPYAHPNAVEELPSFAEGRATSVTPLADCGFHSSITSRVELRGGSCSAERRSSWKRLPHDRRAPSALASATPVASPRRTDPDAGDRSAVPCITAGDGERRRR